MKCLPKIRVSSDTYLKISGNEKNKNFTIGFLAKGNKPYENEVMMNINLTKTSWPRWNKLKKILKEHSDKNFRNFSKTETKSLGFCMFHIWSNNSFQLGDFYLQGYHVEVQNESTIIAEKNQKLKNFHKHGFRLKSNRKFQATKITKTLLIV